jgi:hypothetical protein
MYSSLATTEEDKLVVATRTEKTFIRSDLVADSIARFGGLAPDEFIIAIWVCSCRNLALRLTRCRKATTNCAATVDPLPLHTFKFGSPV